MDDEATCPLSEAIEDEYGLDPPTRDRERCTPRLFPPLIMVKRLKVVEPVMIITTLVSNIFGSVQTNVVEFQYCKAVLNIYNSSVCINTTAPYFIEVQKYTSTFDIFEVICGSVFPILFSVFVGPWSDKFGRRPVLLSNAIGFLVTSCLWMWASSTNLHPNYFLLFGLPSSLCGGKIMTVSAMYCYICDITSLETRAHRLVAILMDCFKSHRLGILQGCLHLGGLIGTLAAPRLILRSYPFAFAVCAFTNAVRSLYILFVLEESVDISEAERTLVSRNPFQMSYIKSIYEACYQKQTSQNFHMLISVALLSFVSSNHSTGEGDVFYLFSQKVLGWSLLEYTPLHCTSIISAAFFAFFGTWLLSTFLGLADMQVINIANALRLFGTLTLVYGRHIWIVYIACILEKANGLSGGMERVFLSRIIHSDDLGKVFTLFGTFDVIAPLTGSLLYNTVYNMTINAYPNAIFIVSAFLCLLTTLLTATIVNLQLRSSDVSRLSSTTMSVNS